MEKLVAEYLNSIVGNNPTLSVLKKETHFIRGLKLPVFKSEYYVNGIKVGIKVGSRADGVSKISMNSELYYTTRNLFGLTHVDTSRYFNQWLSNIPR
jgi:hypothetical protein